MAYYDPEHWDVTQEESEAFDVLVERQFASERRRQLCTLSLLWILVALEVVGVVLSCIEVFG